MNEADKYFAFQEHIATIDNNKNIFSLRFYHPLHLLFEELERQLGRVPRGPQRIRPFQSHRDVRALLKHSKDADVKKYEFCFLKLAECWGKAKPYPSFSNVEKLIRSVKPLLDASKLYACADYNQFPTVANPAKENEVKARATRGVATGLPVIPVGGNAMFTATPSTAWNAQHVERAYSQVVKAKSGECTSFGYFAAHLLKTASDAANVKPRIEVVSWDKISHPVTVLRNPDFDRTKAVSETNTRYIPKMKKVHKIETTKKKYRFFGPPTDIRVFHEMVPATHTRYTTHVFCVVNRTGGCSQVQAGLPAKPMLQLPHFSEWGNDCWVVDPWLASLGYDSAWPVNQYPKPSMLEPVYQQMDSYNTGP